MRPPINPMRRRRAEALMLDRCKVTRADESRPKDELTGDYPVIQVYPDPGWPPTHRFHTGPAKSQTYEAYEQTPEAGGHNYTVQRYAAHFPVGAFEPRVGDVIEWTACPLDPDRVGVRERITAPFSKTLATAQRVFVDRVAD